MKREFEMMKRSCNESSGALLDEMINEDSCIDEKRLKIKNLLENRNEDASNHLFDLLRLLKLMDLPAEAKNATNVVSLITSMRRSNIKEIRNLAEFLFKSLKVLSNEWMNGTEDLTETTGVSVVQCPAKKEDLSFLCGIPFPPPDATQTVSMDYSKIEESIVEKKDVREMRREENITDKKDDTDMKRKPKLVVLKYEDKLEASKRKLREGYKDAEEAKKKRKIMVIDVNDLQPVQSQNKKKPEVKRGCRINKFIKLRLKHDRRSLIW